MNRGHGFIAISLLFVLNCVHYLGYTPDPGKDIDRWIANLGQQRSFEYRYRLQTRTAYVEAQGDCVIGRGEHLRGVWRYADSSLAFEYIGLGDIEYVKATGGWQRVTRGEESDIFAQIQRLLQFDHFEYRGLESHYLYDFRANIPFLAPDRRNEMLGRLMIATDNFLPVMIWAGLPDSSIFWEIKISNYNKLRSLKPPVNNWQEYLITTKKEYPLGDLAKVIKDRLKQCAIDFQLKKVNGSLILMVAEGNDIEDIKTALLPGVVQGYSRAENKESAKRVGYLNGDIGLPVYLGDRIFDRAAIKDVQIRFDESSRPYCRISLNQPLDQNEEILIEVDGLLIGMATLDSGQKLNRMRLYIDLSYEGLEILKARMNVLLPEITVESINEPN